MKIESTYVYVRREDGSLGAYEANNCDSYAEAIDLVKETTGSDRALALIEGGKKD